MEVIDMGKKTNFLLTSMATSKPNPVPGYRGIEMAFSANAESMKTNFGTLHATVASRFENENTTYNPDERRCIDESEEVFKWGSGKGSKQRSHKQRSHKQRLELRRIEMKKFWKFIKDEEGLETVEYAIIGALITLAAIVTITSVGTQVNTRFQQMLTALGG
jgi:pilus assembly protein Flp/PilA